MPVRATNVNDDTCATFFSNVQVFGGPKAGDAATRE